MAEVFKKDCSEVRFWFDPTQKKTGWFKLSLLMGKGGKSTNNT
jgi:hypothetical protein